MAGNPAKCCLFGGSTVLITLCALILVLWPSIYQHIMQANLELSNSSISYNMWKKTPIPMYLEIYMFNWTNPEDAKNKNIKPKFEEFGPYVFSEVHERVNVSWKEGDLIEFNQTRTYHFVPEMSNGSLSDKITSLNVIAASAAYSMRFNPFVLFGIDKLFELVKSELAITRTVDEWLFKGFEDPIINLINRINNSHIPNIPFDKFGWFYNRNGSSSYDGRFEMHTGADDIHNVGILTRWNGVNTTKYYHSYCSMVNGTTGELWPPMNSTIMNATLFASDLCRSLKLEYTGKKVYRNIEGNLYTGGDHLLDNGDKYPENKCFCGSEYEESCLPTGVTNVSQCKFGAPAFISYPHFYLADKFYTDAVDMPPASDSDMFTLALEPVTGIPLDVEAKLQINLQMRPYSQISIFRGINEAYIPCMWFNQRATLTDNLASKLELLLNLPVIANSVLGILLFAGVVAFCVGVYMALWGRWSVKKHHGDHTVLIDEDTPGPVS